VKVLGLILLMLGCAALAVGAAGAGQSVAEARQAPSQSVADTVGNHSRGADHAAPAADGTHVVKPRDDQQERRKVAGNNRPTSKPSVSRSNRRNEPTNGRERSASGDSKNSHSPDSGKSASAAQNGSARSQTVNHSSPNRASSAIRPAVPALSNTRHRGANPAIVGGAGNSNTRNSAALDGTHMKRKSIGN
jgi:hypothetical protein